MGTLWFTDLRNRPTEVLDLTSLTVEEFQPLVAPFEATFQAHLAHWRLDTNRLRKAGVRDQVMEVCCALHNFRVRLTKARQSFLYSGGE